jgi:hypothetical protein
MISEEWFFFFCSGKEYFKLKSTTLFVITPGIYLLHEKNKSSN